MITTMRNTSSDKYHDDHDANDPEDQFQSQIWTYSVLLATIPLLYYGYYMGAFCFVVIGLLYIFQSYFIQQKVPLLDQYKIKYNIYTPEDVIKDIYTLHFKYQNLTEKQIDDANDGNVAHTLFREISVVGFNTLAKKYNQIQEAQKNHRQQKSNVSSDATREMNQKYNDALQHLALQYQDLIHTIVFATKPPIQQQSSVDSATAEKVVDDDYDEMISAALALLALISKQRIVRQRYCLIQEIESSKVTNQPLQELSFENILYCIDMALLRAKKYSNNNDDNDELKDHIAAELQRKACLFIGAISDDGGVTNDQHPKQSLSIQIGQQGGIQTILNAISWYQYHVEVVNWGLWSLFILCYENTINQMILIQLNGIPIMLQSMKNCFDTDANDVKSVVDVARHGTAICFDLLRENQDDCTNVDPSIDRWKVRNAALSAGLHECILQAMTVSMIHSNNTNMDIFVMGREILVGTNYQGSIPEPPMTIIPSSS